MITVPFLFISKQSSFTDGKLTVHDMFDVHYFKPEEVLLENCIVTFGILADREDDQTELEFRIVSKEVHNLNIKIPFNFTYKNDNRITVHNYGIASLPILKNETIRFEIWNNNNLLNTYPVSFIKEKNEDGDADA